LFESIPANVHGYFAQHDEMGVYADLVEANLHFDDTMTAYIEELREKIKRFSKKGAQIDSDEFTQKLLKKCQAEYEGAKKGLCDFMAKKVDFSDFVQFKPYDYIFNIIVKEYDGVIANFDIDNSNTDKLKESIHSHMTDRANGLADKIDERVAKMDAQVELTEEQKSNLVIAAQWGESVSGKDWDSEVAPIVQEWYGNNKGGIESAATTEQFGAHLEDLYNEIVKQPLKTEPSVEVDLEMQFEFTENEVAAFEADIETIVLHYHSLEKDLQAEMDKCAMKEEHTHIIKDKCKRRSPNRSPCVPYNPFVIIERCNQDYVLNAHRECVAACPQGFVERGDSLCKKPEITMLSVKDLEAGECPSLHRRFDHLCIPMCPLGWTDYGATCRRPRYAAQHYTLLA